MRLVDYARRLYSFLLVERIEYLLILLIILGILLRIDSLLKYEIVADGGFYAASGEGLARYHDFRLPWGPTTWTTIANSVTPVSVSRLGLRSWHPWQWV
jgi:hypothetical protein